LEVAGLSARFPTDYGLVRAVEEVSFTLREGETLAVVGESGSGKSVTSLAIMGLLPQGRAHLTADRLVFDGTDLATLSPAERRRACGSRMAMIFQEPMTSLNPVYAVGWQIAEVLVAHAGLSWRQGHKRAIELLAMVGIPEPAERVKAYPHQLSGGMRQRVMIAIALACRPRLLIADEPTTALDVTIQAQILELMRELQRETGTSILFITHDLGVVAEVADRVLVMYAGRVVEAADVVELFEQPRMPYTTGLLRSTTYRPGQTVRQHRLDVIPGNVPSPLALPPGCAFNPRCGHRRQPCTVAMPTLEDAGQGHLVRCARWREVRDCTAGVLA
jgi:oligopeptide/dipeptide ABC transporter ATP-binding protein